MLVGVQVFTIDDIPLDSLQTGVLMEGSQAVVDYLTYNHTLSFTHTHTLSLSLTHTHTHTRTRTYTHTHTQGKVPLLATRVLAWRACHTRRGTSLGP